MIFGIMSGALMLAAVAMAYRPGVSVSTQANPTPRSAATDTGTWFVVGESDTGPLKAVLVKSMAEFTRIFGGRMSYSFLYDALDTFFHEGGAQAYIGRVVGPAAVIASHNLLDGVAAVSLIASAKGPGAGTAADAGNNLQVAVLAGVATGYRIQVLDTNNVVLETSGDLTTQQDAVNWSKTSSYLDIAVGAAADAPAVAAAAHLAGGADDRASVTDAQWLAALNLFGPDLGPGQVSAPGRTTDPGHAQLTAHAQANNRVALLDLPDTATAATLEASGIAARTSQPYGAAFTPWVLAPGIVAGSVRTVPPSALIAGLIARNDPANTADTPSAGKLGQAIWVTGLSQTAFDSDPSTRQALANASVNVIRNMFGGVRNYGWRALVDPVATPEWEDFGNVRLNMAILAQAEAIGEEFIFSPIDGQGILIGHFNAALAAMLDQFWQDGALYGLTASDAYFVDTSASVNTPTTIAANELHAVLNVKMSPDAEFVQINVVKVPITEGV